MSLVEIISIGKTKLNNQESLLTINITFQRDGPMKTNCSYECDECALHSENHLEKLQNDLFSNYDATHNDQVGVSFAFNLIYSDFIAEKWHMISKGTFQMVKYCECSFSLVTIFLESLTPFSGLVGSAIVMERDQLWRCQ